MAVVLKEIDATKIYIYEGLLVACRCGTCRETKKAIDGEYCFTCWYNGRTGFMKKIKIGE